MVQLMFAFVLPRAWAFLYSQLVQNRLLAVKQPAFLSGIVELFQDIIRTGKNYPACQKRI